MSVFCAIERGQHIHRCFTGLDVVDSTGSVQRLLFDRDQGKIFTPMFAVERRVCKIEVVWCLGKQQALGAMTADGSREQRARHVLADKTLMRPIRISYSKFRSQPCSYIYLMRWIMSFFAIHYLSLRFFDLTGISHHAHA